MSTTNVLMTCQVPELRCSFGGLVSISASKTTSSGQAPDLPWCDHIPLQRACVGHSSARDANCSVWDGNIGGWGGLLLPETAPADSGWTIQ